MIHIERNVVTISRLSFSLLYMYIYLTPGMHINKEIMSLDNTINFYCHFHDAKYSDIFLFQN